MALVLQQSVNLGAFTRALDTEQHINSTARGPNYSVWDAQSGGRRATRVLFKTQLLPNIDRMPLDLSKGG